MCWIWRQIWGISYCVQYSYSVVQSNQIQYEMFMKLNLHQLIDSKVQLTKAYSSVVNGIAVTETPTETLLLMYYPQWNVENRKAKMYIFFYFLWAIFHQNHRKCLYLNIYILHFYVILHKIHKYPPEIYRESSFQIIVRVHVHMHFNLSIGNY